MRLSAAWTACDMAAAIALSLTYEEVVALTSKPLDRAEWSKTACIGNAQVQPLARDPFDEEIWGELASGIHYSTLDFADERCREFAQSHGHILTAKIVKTEHHDPTEAQELKAPIDIVFVQLVVEENGVANLRGTLMPFIRVGDGFKFVSKP